MIDVCMNLPLYLTVRAHKRGKAAMGDDALAILKRFQRSILPLVEEKIALGCPILDGVLHGGVRCGMITEVTGKPMT